MVYFKDIEDIRYREIIDSSFTPLKLRLDWAQKTKEGKAAVQLFITKDFETNQNKYYLMVGLPIENDYIILNYLCQQPPNFVISDICYLIINNIQNHGNNSYLVNQYLNSSGYKNLDHIVMDIFIQEMAIQIGQHVLTETAVLFNDYSYLIQRALKDVQTSINTIQLIQGVDQDFFFFMLAVEESIHKLNQEFMFLYFCFYKLAKVEKYGSTVVALRLNILKSNYFDRIGHHIGSLKNSLNLFRIQRYASHSTVVESIDLQLENLLRNMEFFENKESSFNKLFFEMETQLPESALK